LLPAFAAQICSPVVITSTIPREEDRHQLVFAPPAQVKLTQKPASIPFAPFHLMPDSFDFFRGLLRFYERDLAHHAPHSDVSQR
jgi:hypothetical protein